MQDWKAWILSLTTLFSFYKVLLFWLKKMPEVTKWKKRQIMKRRIRRSIRFILKNYIYAFLCILIISSMYPSAKYNSAQKDDKSEAVVDFIDKIHLTERTMESEREILWQADRNWKEFDEEEKKQVLERIVEVEASHLGLGYSITLFVKDLDDIVIGRYRDYEIQIQRKYLKESSFLQQVENITHEVYHAYQSLEIERYESVQSQDEKDGLKKEDGSYLYGEERKNAVRVWQKEFEEYEDGTDAADSESALLRYYYQTVEVSARLYSERRTEEYRRFIKRN